MNNRGNALVETISTILLFSSVMAALFSAYYIYYCQTWVQHLNYRLGLCYLAKNVSANECLSKTHSLNNKLFLPNTIFSSSVNKKIDGSYKKSTAISIWASPIFSKRFRTKTTVSDRVYRKWRR